MSEFTEISRLLWSSHASVNRNPWLGRHLRKEEHIVVQRDRRIKDEVRGLATVLGRRRKPLPPPRRGVAHAELLQRLRDPVLEEEKAVTLVHERGFFPPELGQEAEFGVNTRRRAAGEEVGALLPFAVDEHAAKAARHAVRERQEEIPAVDDGAQVLADAPAHSKRPWREASEDVREQLFGEAVHGWLAGAVARRGRSSPPIRVGVLVAAVGRCGARKPNRPDGPPTGRSSHSLLLNQQMLGDYMQTIGQANHTT